MQTGLCRGDGNHVSFLAKKSFEVRENKINNCLITFSGVRKNLLRRQKRENSGNLKKEVSKGFSAEIFRIFRCSQNKKTSLVNSKFDLSREFRYLLKKIFSTNSKLSFPRELQKKSSANLKPSLTFYSNFGVFQQKCSGGMAQYPSLPLSTLVVTLIVLNNDRVSFA